MKPLMPFKYSYIFITPLFKWISHAGVMLRFDTPDAQEETYGKSGTLTNWGVHGVPFLDLAEGKCSLALFMSPKRLACLNPPYFGPLPDYST